jgi:hypothetical protein
MKFHMPRISSSLITPTKPEANCRFRDAVLLFYILQIITLIKAEHYGYELKKYGACREAKRKEDG